LGVRAFIEGMAPVTIGMLASSGWVLTEPSRTQWLCVPLVAASALLMVRTKISPLWLIAGGAVVGALGLI
jgi:chromate transporter